MTPFDDPAILSTLRGVFALVVPEILLVAAACVLFVGGTVTPSKKIWGRVAVGALAVAAAMAFVSTLAGGDLHLPLGHSTAKLTVTHAESIRTVGPLAVDHFASLIRLVAVLGGLVLVLLSWDEVPESVAAEYFACLLIATVGLSLSAAANELVTLFLALELISIPTYVLLYLARPDERAREAAVKYFLLSIFSSAILLFGFSYLYGLTGTTNLPAIVATLVNAGSGEPLALGLVAVVMVVVGLGFKITAVPFHFYAPDVYTGVPASAAGFLAFVPKVAGFAALARVFGLVGTESGPAFVSQLPLLFWILAAVTMTVGNILALLQDNLKRMLAYSGVAHGGYMLIGLAAAPELTGRAGPTAFGGIEAVLFYLVAYAAMTLGAFAVLAALDTPRGPVESVDDLSGLASSHPGASATLAVFLFSLIGLPLTAGFAGKMLLFLGALTVADSPTVAGLPVGSGGLDQMLYSLGLLKTASGSQSVAGLFRLLVVIAAINAGIAAYYYLRILGVMYLRSALAPIEKRVTAPTWIALGLCAAATVGLGVYPWPLFRAARTASAPIVEQATAPGFDRGE